MSYKSYLLITGFILLNSALYGCADNKDGSSEDNSLLSKLEGTWQRACFNSLIEGNTSEQVTLVFSKNQITQTRARYSGLDCAELKQEIIIAGPVDIGETVNTANGDTAQKADITINSYFWTPKTTDVVEEFNTSEFCGLTNWQLNQANEVTGKNCDSTVLESIKNYSLFALDSTVEPNKFYFGDFDTGDGSTDESRPTELDKQDPFIKVK